ncbi:MAG: HEAT repeat domain-containing protein [Nitrospiraceae bacterium]
MIRIRMLMLGWLLGVGALPSPIVANLAFASWNDALLVQMPYEAPPKPQPAPDTSVPPNTTPLTPDELRRAEALLPLLEGKQELWAIGEFVHLGPPAVPVLVKALKMPGPRIRYNAIEALLIIKDPSAVLALIETAREPAEMPRIREHALRAAVRLDPSQVAPAIETMTKDPEPAIRKAAAFEARYVRNKAVVPVLIEVLRDDQERFVAITAVQSLWLLTRHTTEIHDWETSTPQDRAEWAQEWSDWWKASQENFELPDSSRPKKGL